MMSLKEFVCNDCGFEFEDDDVYECPDCSSINIEETYLDGCPEYDDMSGDFDEEDEEPSRDIGFTDEDKEMFAIADAINSIEDDEGEE